MQDMMIIKPSILQEDQPYYKSGKYRFRPNEQQRAFIQNAYKMQKKISIGTNIQFMQSANYLNGNSIDISWIPDGQTLPITGTIDLTGTFYDMKEFQAFLLPLLQYEVNADPLLTTLQFGIDEIVLQNENKFKLKVIHYNGIHNVTLTFKGYQINQMLGLTNYPEIDSVQTYTYLEIVGNSVTGYKHTFMPVCQVLNTTLSFQKNMMMCADGMIRPIVATLLNTVLQGDYAAFQNNIEISPVQYDDMLSDWYMIFYDQNYVPLPPMQDVQIIISFNMPQMDGRGVYKGRILTNRDID